MSDTSEKLKRLLFDIPCESECEGELGSCPDRKYGKCKRMDRLEYCTVQKIVDHFIANGVIVREWVSASAPPEEHESIWAKLYGTKSWQPGLFRKCSYDVLACVEKKDGSRRVISIRTYDGKWDHNKLNEETVICWQPLPEPPEVGK